MIAAYEKKLLRGKNMSGSCKRPTEGLTKGQICEAKKQKLEVIEIDNSEYKNTNINVFCTFENFCRIQVQLQKLMTRRWRTRILQMQSMEKNMKVLKL